jgi:hypothetical protein
MASARADDTVNLQQLLRVIDSFANYGAIEYSTWAHGRLSWTSDANALTEPKFSVLGGGEDALARRRYAGCCSMHSSCGFPDLFALVLWCMLQL